MGTFINGKPTGQVLKEVLVPPESSGGLIEARLQGLDEKVHCYIMKE